MEQAIAENFNRVFDELGLLSNRAGRLELRMTGVENVQKDTLEMLAVFRSDVLGHFDALYKKLDFITDEYHASS